MTQRDRVLAALALGPVSPISFIRHPTVDGGPPILRVAARIHELRADGHEITETRAPDGTAVYTLASPRSSRAGNTAPPPSDPGAGEPLFNPAAYERPGWMDAA